MYEPLVLNVWNSLEGEYGILRELLTIFILEEFGKANYDMESHIGRYIKGTVKC